MLERDPTKRISASELLQHPWIKVCWNLIWMNIISRFICIAWNAKTNRIYKWWIINTTTDETRNTTATIIDSKVQLDFPKKRIYMNDIFSFHRWKILIQFNHQRLVVLWGILMNYKKRFCLHYFLYYRIS
jgi:serine/threonine protein kinase